MIAVSSPKAQERPSAQEHDDDDDDDLNSAIKRDHWLPIDYFVLGKCLIRKS